MRLTIVTSTSTLSRTSIGVVAMNHEKLGWLTAFLHVWMGMRDSESDDKNGGIDPHPCLSPFSYSPT